MRFSKDYKLFAAYLYKLSGKCYQFLRRIFKLPLKSTILNYLSAIDLKPGINPFVFSHLYKMGKSGIAHRNQKNKACSIMFDEMSIVPNLTYMKHRGSIKGMEDYGNRHRTDEIASNVLILILMCVSKYIVSHTITRFTQFFVTMTLIEKT